MPVDARVAIGAAAAADRGCEAEGLLRGADRVDELLLLLPEARD
jgi:hypothetical protein